jgi:hypothetical protein
MTSSPAASAAGSLFIVCGLVSPLLRTANNDNNNNNNEFEFEAASKKLSDD